MRLAGILFLIVAVAGLSACQPGATAGHGPDRAALRQCQAQSGYAARAAAARDAGVEGEVLPDTTESAAIAACMGARDLSSTQPVSAGQGRPAVCRLEMVGGTGYRCGPDHRGY